jgi:hypothetical protein
VSKFDFNTVLPVSAYNSVSSLPTSIPPELLSRSNEHIGDVFPDAGYTDVRASVNGVYYRWFFEAGQSASSAEVQAFVTQARACFSY